MMTLLQELRAREIHSWETTVMKENEKSENKLETMPPFPWPKC
jgi:hypothetical protein